MIVYARFIAVSILFLNALVSCATAAEIRPSSKVSIRSDFPGGNIIVREIAEEVVHVEPDLRGGRDWFYWCFAACTDEPQRLTFVFPEKQMTFVGNQGPAVSHDAGETWSWLGAEDANGASFTFTFEAGQEVYFAVTIPYLQSNLDRFLSDHRGNDHLTVSLLTRTKQGRPVELLRIGEPGDGRIPVLMTARHHACETMASYLLEGFLRCALSDEEPGRSFRARYVLYVVPIVDKDGVQDGDQGKNRRPHDHNRDYGDDPRYPEVAAIAELGENASIKMAVDFHCPTLWMDYHQVIYFPGPRDTPETNLNNVTQLAELLKAELPEEAPRGCLVMLKSERTPGHFSDHFSRRPEAMMAVTLEFPYASPGKQMDSASCLSYGECLLRAWNQAEFEGR